MVTEAAAAGQTVLLSSHVLSEVERSADRVGVLYRGKLVMLGAVSELRPARRRTTRAVIGAPREAVSARLTGIVPDDGTTMTDDKSGTLLRADIDDVDAFVKALAGLPVLDLVIVEPQLEDVVLELYRATGAAHDA